MFSSLSVPPPFISPSLCLFSPPQMSLYSDPSPPSLFFRIVPPLCSTSHCLLLLLGFPILLVLPSFSLSLLFLPLCFCLRHQSFHFLSVPSQPPLTVHFTIYWFFFFHPPLLYFCLNFPSSLHLYAVLSPYHLPSCHSLLWFRPTGTKYLKQEEIGKKV